MERLPIELWGRDHWTLITYVESCAVDKGGEIDIRKLRINPETHSQYRAGGFRTWTPEHGSSVREGDGWGKIGPHDDIDCLEDLEASGLVEIISLISGVVRLTKSGFRFAASLRWHLINGGQYRDFKPTQDGDLLVVVGLD